MAKARRPLLGPEPNYTVTVVSGFERVFDVTLYAETRDKAERGAVKRAEQRWPERVFVAADTRKLR